MRILLSVDNVVADAQTQITDRVESSGAAENAPYVITVWRSAYLTLGAFETFQEALTAYAKVTDRTKQLVNVDRAECGRDGLTEDERDQVAAVAHAEEQSARVA
jgi:hypothetical protein